MKRAPVIARLEIRYKDLDPYGHINNAVHLEFWRALADLMGFELRTVDTLEEGLVAEGRPQESLAPERD